MIARSRTSIQKSCLSAFSRKGATPSTMRMLIAATRSRSTTPSLTPCRVVESCAGAKISQGVCVIASPVRQREKARGPEDQHKGHGKIDQDGGKRRPGR